MDLEADQRASSSEEPATVDDDPQTLDKASKCANYRLHINELPDSIFLQIFSYMSFPSLGNLAQVCHQWRQICLDDLLWKAAFLDYYKLPSSTTIAPGAISWRREFKRLYYYTPCIMSEERKAHNDEVLHVSFSHDGTLFATCSKDGFFRVWKSSHPARLLFEKNMMTNFNWKYTQFSQFNESDTRLLVSGVYFGGRNRSGEIAVFDLQGDFLLQCRVNNKPYDVFGAWYDNNHLLSGTLYVTGNFASVSAIWLSKASQEVESEMESVSMVLYRFTNVNASTVRLLHVAEVETEQPEDKEKTLPAPHSLDPCCQQSGMSEGDHADCSSTRYPRRTCPHNAVPTEMSDCFQKPLAEGEFDVSDEDESDDNIDTLEDEIEMWDASNVQCIYSVPTHPREEDIHILHYPLAATSGPLRSSRGSYASASYLFDYVENIPSNISNRSASLSPGEAPRDLADRSADSSHLSEDSSNPLNDETSASCEQSTSDHKPPQALKNGAGCDDNSGDDVSNNCRTASTPLTDREAASAGKERDGEREEGAWGGLTDNATQTEGDSLSEASSLQSMSSHLSQGQSASISKELCKNPREKLLIFTWGTETYIPHMIGFKRMKTTDFNRGPRQASMLLPDVMENLNSMSGSSRKDVPDFSIDMRGYIIGLSLSPDHRYLYVNCRVWPKGCVITRPMQSLPLAQEVEIFCVDLTTFQLTGQVLRSHRAYTDSAKCFFLNLDVSEHYVVSGAEDSRGYIWDRHYGIPLYHFNHRNVVNSVALNPHDPQMAVSVSDDHTFKIWVSRRRRKRFQAKGIKFGERKGTGYRFNNMNS